MIHARQDYNRIQDPEGKIGEDEPVFLLRATDNVAGHAVLAWAGLADAAGASKDIVKAALQHATRISEWQDANPDKVHVPDMPQESGEDK